MDNSSLSTTAFRTFFKDGQYVMMGRLQEEGFGGLEVKVTETPTGTASLSAPGLYPVILDYDNLVSAPPTSYMWLSPGRLRRGRLGTGTQVSSETLGGKREGLEEQIQRREKSLMEIESGQRSQDNYVRRMRALLLACLASVAQCAPQSLVIPFTSSQDLPEVRKRREVTQASRSPASMSPQPSCCARPGL